MRRSEAYTKFSRKTAVPGAKDARQETHRAQLVDPGVVKLAYGTRKMRNTALNGTSLDKRALVCTPLGETLLSLTRFLACEADDVVVEGARRASEKKGRELLLHASCSLLVPGFAPLVWSAEGRGKAVGASRGTLVSRKGSGGHGVLRWSNGGRTSATRGLVLGARVLVPWALSLRSGDVARVARRAKK